MMDGDLELWGYAARKGIWLNYDGTIERNYTSSPGINRFKTDTEARSWLIQAAKMDEMLTKVVALSVKLRMGLRLGS